MYCFFVIEHGRWRILHFDCTAHPAVNRVVQQLRGDLPYLITVKLCSKVIRSLAMSFVGFLKASALNRWERVFGAHGKTESPNDGSTRVRVSGLLP